MIFAELQTAHADGFIIGVLFGIFVTVMAYFIVGPGSKGG